MREIEILKEINKNAKMGMDALTEVTPKVQDNNFKELLDTQHNEYQNIFDRSQEILVQKGEKMEDVPAMQKMMSWMGIQFNTLTDKSNSQIAELLIQGNDMGVVKGVKILNNSTITNSEVENLVSDFIRLQEKNVQDLKNYL